MFLYKKKEYSILHKYLEKTKNFKCQVQIFFGDPSSIFFLSSIVFFSFFYFFPLMNAAMLFTSSFVLNCTDLRVGKISPL